MCGRYALAGDWSEFTEEFDLEEVPGLVPRFNIAPSSGPGFESPIIVERRVLVPARFWYIPSWWGKPLKELPTSFNARSETALSKPFFRGARRCLIPTSGWREFPGPAGQKRAFSFERRIKEQDHPEFFAFAGLCSVWEDRKTEEPVHTFAILTGEPSAAVEPHHNRMPLIVPKNTYSEWLDESVPYERLISTVTETSHKADLHVYECSTYGNSTRVEGPACIAPAMTQGSLFD